MLIRNLLFLFLFTRAFVANPQSEVSDLLLDTLKRNLAKHEAHEMEQNSVKLLRVSEEENNTEMQIEAIKFMGIAQHLQSRYDSAIYWYSKGLELSERLKDSTNWAKCYLNIATSYNKKGLYEQAVENALRSLKIFEKKGDINGQARVQNMIGIFYFNRDNYEMALNYFEKYQKLAVAANDSGEIVSALNNTASALHLLGRSDEEQQLLRKSIAIQEAQGQYIRIGSAYENLGALYLDSDSLQQAIVFFEKARKSYQINKNIYNLARSNLQIARVKKKQKRYPEAIAAIQQTLAYCEEGGFLKLKEDALYQMALVYNEQLDYKKAYNTFVDYVATKDSVFNEKNQESINTLMIEYETEKKEHQIAQQQLEITQRTLENKRKSTAIIFLSGALVILLLMVFIVYSRIRIKQERRLNQERVQMQQLQMKVVLESQENERRRFARDLHDGFGQLITAVKMMLTQMHTSTSKQERSEIALKSNEVLDSMHSQLREIAHNLMSEQLMEEGLEAALRDYARRISRTTDIQIEFYTFGLDKNLNQTVEINLYRIIQEWINNVIKYSGAKNISLQLTGFDNEINLLIEDNGEGFNKEKLMNSSGWGWKNIQSRLEAINGKLEIDSGEGFPGTSFILDFPVA
ncbi:MAG: tetratricopeptide repeat protein [Draconibacterium sp.]